MRNEADALGYFLDEIPVEPGVTDAASITRILRARGIQGVLFLPTFRDPRTIDIEWERFALVGMEFGRADMPHVIRDFFAASSDAYSHLRGMGYRRIGMVVSPGFKPEGIARMLGGFTARQTLDRSHHPVPPLVDPEPGDLAPWLTLHEPDAVIDWRPETMDDLRALGVRVPEEMGFAGLLDVEETPDRAIAGIHHSATRIGSEAVRIAHRFILAGNTGLSPHPLTVLIPGEWRDGESVRMWQPTGRGSGFRAPWVDPNQR